MFKVFVFIACVCTAFGLPLDQSLPEVDHPHAHHPAQITPIVSEEFDNTGDGNFHFGFVSGDGTKVQEDGVLNVYDEKNSEEVVHGSYEYTSPEGRSIKVQYLADGSGFHAFSDDIPKSAGVDSQAQYGNYVNEHHRARSFPVTEQKVNVVPVQAFPGNQGFNYPANAYNVQN
ncbi:larval cuticle protein 1-like [Coccinella septempunctata]|uniref:larval cuticle protein 1-like n=1 Tax=Coccinella septempunctata TaxID=41139 RepID=UPI001D06E667|nr:larval cuticle protein 1-like [Coccinella septempunctata]